MTENLISELQPAALVTAGAKRVGRSLALRLAECGFDIALHYKESKLEAESTAKEIGEIGRQCTLFNADLCVSNELENLIPSALAKFPGLCILINNASIWKPGKLIDSTIEDFNSNIKIHLEAPYILTRDFARHAKHGHVVNIIDSNVTKNQTAHFAYLLSKKALHDFTLLAAGELAPQIRVNAIAPGAVLTPENERKEKYEDKFSNNPLQLAGSPDDVATALEFLIKSSHITGQCIFVSGGKHLT